MANLSNNNRNDLKLVLNESEYWDFFIHKGDNVCNGISSNNSLTNRCLQSYIDFTDNDCLFDSFVLSKPNYYYKNAVLTNSILYNIGFCGVDNGIIQFRKDRITNEEFVKLFTKSTLNLNTERLKLFEVSGNTLQYSYDLSYDDKNGAKLNGGFFQGFFMTKCEEYKVLPTEIEDTWYFEITLKKENFEKNDSNNTLNDKHPNNKGMFLYIGTRAENKWMLLYDESLDSNYKSEYIDNNENAYLYDKDKVIRNESDYINVRNYIQKEITYPYVIDGYFTELPNEDVKPIKHLSFIQDEYFDLSEYECCENDNDGFFCKKLDIPKCNKDGIVKIGSCNNISDECVDYLNSNKCCNSIKINNSDCKGCCNIPFISWRFDYYDGVSLTSNKCTCNNCYSNIINADWLQENAFDMDNEYYITDCYYLKEDLDISNFIYETTESVRIDLNEKLIKTDNKFLLFNRTEDGFTVNNWEEGSYGYFTFSKNEIDGNLFLLANRTETGYTVETINSLRKESMKKYDYKQDLYNNALGFRITDEGKIGYKYLVKDCDTNDIKIEEFYSNIFIEDDKWYTVGIKLSKYGKKMRIFIYVNGILILCSKYLPLLRLRELNEEYSKQESVPYNISIGGGTQGLCDVILPNYYRIVETVFPLEENFGGSFIGYIKSFRFYDCLLDKVEIENNFNFDKVNI